MQRSVLRRARRTISKEGGPCASAAEASGSPDDRESQILRHRDSPWQRLSGAIAAKPPRRFACRSAECARSPRRPEEHTVGVHGVSLEETRGSRCASELDQLRRRAETQNLAGDHVLDPPSQCRRARRRPAAELHAGGRALGVESDWPAVAGVPATGAALSPSLGCRGCSWLETRIISSASRAPRAPRDRGRGKRCIAGLGTVRKVGDERCSPRQRLRS